jgi:hypothetical protein
MAHIMKTSNSPFAAALSRSSRMVDAGRGGFVGSVDIKDSPSLLILRRRALARRLEG